MATNLKTNPSYREMVMAAITNLAERKGSSRQAIQKYVVNTFALVDEKRASTHIKIALLKGIEKGELTRSKGFGVCGSFTLGKKLPGTNAKKTEVNRSEPKTKSIKKLNKKDPQKDEKKNPAPKEKKKTVEKTKPVSKVKSGDKPSKVKKPLKVLTSERVQGKSAKTSKASTTSKILTPLSKGTKIRTKVLLTATPKNHKISKLLTPKRTVIRTKQSVRKPITSARKL